MRLKDVVDIFNAVLADIHRIESSPGTDEPFILFGPPYEHGLVGEAQTEGFERALEGLLSFQKEIGLTISKTRVRELFRNFLWDVLNDPNHSRTLTEREVQSLIQALLDAPMVTWEVIRPLFGASLSSDSPIQLGPCTIYNWNAHKEHLVYGGPAAHGKLERLTAENARIKAPGQPLLISVKTKARDHLIAQQSADVTIQSIEYVFRYMVSFIRGLRNPISIFEHPHEVRHLGVAVSDDERVFESTAYKSSYGAELLLGFELDLADPIFQDEKLGFPRLWQTLRDESSADNLSRRILSAAIWLGKGISDPDPSRRLVQYVFALEALLTFREEGVLVSPSIASQIAESAAFITSNKLPDRMETEASVKRLYDVRSNIAHGRKHDITRRDVDQALNLVKWLIVRLSTHPELKHLKSQKQLRDWVTQQKYSEREIPTTE